MSFNQVLRYVGYAIGSALSATILAAHTPHGQALPLDSGYESVAVLGCGVLAIAAVVSFLLPRAGVVFDRLLVEETIADAVPYDESPRQRAVH
jgi:hypothetical protein